MIDELDGWGLPPPLLTADAGYGQVAEFRQGLADRGIAHIVATTSSTTAQPGKAHPVAVAYPGVGNIRHREIRIRPAPSKTCATAKTSMICCRPVRADDLHRHKQRRSPRPAVERHQLRTLDAVRASHADQRRQLPHRYSDPKTPYSRSWIALSRRAIDALHRQQDRQRRQRLATSHYEETGLVFSQPDGQPSRPQYELDHFHKLTEEAGVPTTRLHDLRHLAATS